MDDSFQVFVWINSRTVSDHPLNNRPILCMPVTGTTKATQRSIKARFHTLHPSHLREGSLLTIRTVLQHVNFLLGGRHVPELPNDARDTHQEQYARTFGYLGYETRIYDKARRSPGDLWPEECMDQLLEPGLSLYICVPEERGSTAFLQRLSGLILDATRSKRDESSNSTEGNNFLAKIKQWYPDEAGACAVAGGPSFALEGARIVDPRFDEDLVKCMSEAVAKVTGSFEDFDDLVEGASLYGIGDIRGPMHEEKSENSSPANHPTNGFVVSSTLRKLYDDFFWVIFGDTGIWLSKPMDTTWNSVTNSSVYKKLGWKAPEEDHHRVITTSIKSTIALIYQFCPAATLKAMRPPNTLKRKFSQMKDTCTVLAGEGSNNDEMNHDNGNGTEQDIGNGIEWDGGDGIEQDIGDRIEQDSDDDDESYEARIKEEEEEERENIIRTVFAFMVAHHQVSAQFVTS